SIEDSKERPGDGAGHTPAKSDRDTEWSVNPGARIGAKVKNGDIGGGFEYGTMGGNANLRLLYGTWNFGAGQLLIGQNYPPCNLIISNEAFFAGIYASNGVLYEGRRPMIQLRFGDFKFALVQPGTGGSATITGVVTGGEVDTTLPKIEAKYTFRTDRFRVGVVGGYNSYEVNSDMKDYDVDSWVAALWGQVNMGPAYVKGNVFKAINGGAFGLASSGDDDFDFVGNKVKDVDTLAYVLIAGAKLNEMFAVQAAYGHINHDSDVVGAKDDETTSYYVQTTITLAPGVSITPEVGRVDYEKNSANVKEGDETYVGALWQVYF
ncbi:MAG: hypothetical protein HKO79_03515, partial [Desulfobacterales bacterium]|nr:hypothetical protein [Desulfobacterales bacterium]